MPAKTKKSTTKKVAARKVATKKPVTQEMEEPESKVRDGKTTITVRLDSDVVDWFKNQGPKYQTRMNQVLLKYMEGKSCPEVDAQQERNLIRDLQCNNQRSLNEYFFALNRLGDYWLNHYDGTKSNSYFQQVVDTFNSEKSS